MAKVESGSELLARLCQKPSTKNLDPEMFPTGVEPKSIVELCGEEGSGKTQYLTHVIANAILPRSLKGIGVGGLGVGVVLVDNDYSFNVIRLISVLELRISSVLNTTSVSNVDETGNIETNSNNETASHNDDQPSFWKPDVLPCAQDPRENQNDCPDLAAEQDIEICVEECLKRLYIVRCSSSAQFLITLHSIESVLTSRSELCLLLIDSISSFVWTDKYGGSESNASQIVKMLQRLVDTYSLVLFAARNPAIFLHRTQKKQDHGSAREKYGDHLGNSWEKLVTHRIVFAKDSGPDCACRAPTFCASIGKNWRKYFTIDERGLNFKTPFRSDQRMN